MTGGAVDEKRSPPVGPDGVYDVFISYAREDELQVSLIENALEDVGWRVFRDFDMKAGDSLDATIDAHVASARVVLICWSAHAVQSEWVTREAKAAGEKYLSVTLDGVKPPAPFEDSLAPNFRNWAGWRGTRAMRSLVRGLAGRLGWPDRGRAADFETWLDLDQRQRGLANLWFGFGAAALLYGLGMWIASQNGGRTPIDVLIEPERVKGSLIALVITPLFLVFSQIALTRFVRLRRQEPWSLRVPWIGLSPPRRSASSAARAGLLLFALTLLPLASTIHFANIVTNEGVVVLCKSHRQPTGVVEIDAWRHAPRVAEFWGRQTYCFGGTRLDEVSKYGVFFAPVIQPLLMTALLGLCWALTALNFWALFIDRLSPPPPSDGG